MVQALHSVPAEVKLSILLSPPIVCFRSFIIWNAIDLKDSRYHNIEEATSFTQKMAELTLKWKNLPIGTIACLKGGVFGFGLELALACDLRVSSSDAKICLPETGLGIFPGAGGAVWLKDHVSLGFAKEMILTGRIVEAEEACEHGLLNYICDTNTTAEEKSTELAQLICANGPLGIRYAKHVMNSAITDPHNALNESLELRLKLNSTEDFKNALIAHGEKTHKSFKGC